MQMSLSKMRLGTVGQERVEGEGGKERRKDGRRAERQVLHFQLFRVESTQDESILFLNDLFCYYCLFIYFLFTRTT